MPPFQIFRKTLTHFQRKPGTKQPTGLVDLSVGHPSTCTSCPSWMINRGWNVPCFKRLGLNVPWCKRGWCKEHLKLRLCDWLMFLHVQQVYRFFWIRWVYLFSLTFATCTYYVPLGQWEEDPKIFTHCPLPTMVLKKHPFFCWFYYFLGMKKVLCSTSPFSFAPPPAHPQTMASFTRLRNVTISLYRKNLWER